MGFLNSKSSRRRRAIVITVAALLVLALGGWFAWQRITRVRALATPPRAELTDRGSDPEHDPETVPSFKEALAYIHLCRKRKLSESEVDRVLELARDKNYPLTATYAIGVLQSINEPTRRDQIIAVLVEDLNNPDSSVRASAIGALGNMGAKDKAPLLVPFLKSPQEVERKSARSALAKLGYKLPKDED